MRTVWYFKGKKTTKKALVLAFGRKRVDTMYKEARNDFMRDPNLASDYANGVSVRFIF